MRPLAILVVCVSVVTGVTAAPPQGAASLSPTAPIVPKDVGKALKDVFPGWQPAVPDAPCQVPAGVSPSIVQADFNSDTLADFAVQLRATAPGVALAVAMARLDAYSVVPVDTGAGAAAPRVLSVAKRGAKYRSPISGFEDHFAHDTLVATTCAGDRTAYFWTGTSFSGLALGK